MWQCMRQLLQICGWGMDHVDPNADTSPRAPLIANASSSSSSPLKALVFSVTLLVPLEKRIAQLRREIIELDRRADEIFTSLSNHISFVIVFNGAGVILQSGNISCTTVACMITPTLLIPFVIGVALAISMTYIKLQRLTPSKEIITRRKNKIASMAQFACEIEESRLRGSLEDEEITFSNVHHMENAIDVFHRLQAIATPINLSRIENGYCCLIGHAIVSGIAYVVVVCVIVYFTYFTGAANGLNEIWRKNPMMPRNPMCEGS